MQSRVFVCLKKQKLANFNVFLQNLRKDVLKARKRARSSKPSRAGARTSFRMSSPEKSLNQSISLSDKSIPVPKINKLNELRDIELLLSSCLHALLATPKEDVHSKVLRKARKLATRRGFDKSQFNRSWAESYLKKHEHLLLNNKVTENVLKSSATAIPSQAEDHKVDEDEVLEEFPELDLLNLFEAPTKLPETTTTKRKRTLPPSGATTVRTEKRIKLDSRSEEPHLIEQLNNLCKINQALKQHSNTKVQFFEQRPKRGRRKKNVDDFFQDEKTLFHRKFYAPRRTGCILLRSDATNPIQKSSQYSDDLEELFSIFHDSKDSSHVINCRSKSDETDDCDSGYRSRAESHDSEKSHDNHAQQPTAKSVRNCECARCTGFMPTIPTSITHNSKHNDILSSDESFTSFLDDIDCDELSRDQNNSANNVNWLENLLFEVQNNTV